MDEGLFAQGEQAAIYRRHRGMKSIAAAMPLSQRASLFDGHHSRYLAQALPYRAGAVKAII